MRVSLRDDTAETKSASSRRNVGLPRALVELLRVHHDEQQSEREAAGQLWRDGGWLFATPTGDPVNPRTDYKDWKRLVSTAGLRDGRLHDARHTAATALLILGVPERAVMGLMGWPNPAMVARYQHLTLPVLDGVADRVGELLWGGADEPSETKTERFRLSLISLPGRCAGHRPTAWRSGPLTGELVIRRVQLQALRSGQAPVNGRGERLVLALAEVSTDPVR